MTKTHSEARFEKARSRLSGALLELEEVTKKKLHEARIETKIFDVDDDFNGGRAKLVEQSEVIQNLSLEVNNLQKNLSALGRESEFLHEKNKIFAQKIAGIRTEQSCLIEAIEADVAGLEEIIKKSYGY